MNDLSPPSSSSSPASTPNPPRSRTRLHLNSGSPSQPTDAPLDPDHHENTSDFNNDNLHQLFHTDMFPFPSFRRTRHVNLDSDVSDSPGNNSDSDSVIPSRPISNTRPRINRDSFRHPVHSSAVSSPWRYRINNSDDINSDDDFLESNHTSPNIPMGRIHRYLNRPLDTHNSIQNNSYHHHHHHHHFDGQLNDIIPTNSPSLSPSSTLSLSPSTIPSPFNPPRRFSSSTSLQPRHADSAINLRRVSPNLTRRADRSPPPWIPLWANPDNDRSPSRSIPSRQMFRLTSQATSPDLSLPSQDHVTRRNGTSTRSVAPLRSTILPSTSNSVTGPTAIDNNNEMNQHNSSSIASSNSGGNDIDMDCNSLHSSSSSSILGPTAAIEDLLKCFICYEHLKHAVMCPHCSKMACKDCFRRWLMTERSQCPHCRHFLNVQTLVQCRFIEEIQSHVKNLATCMAEVKDKQQETPTETKSVELCKTHNTPLYYYCSTCEGTICSDCAMFDPVHHGHEFTHLNKVYEQHLDRVQAAADNVAGDTQKYVCALVQIEEQLTNIHGARTKIHQEIEQIFNKTIAALDKQVFDFTEALTDERIHLEKTISTMNEMAKKVIHKAKSMLPSHLVSTSVSLISELEDARNAVQFPNMQTSVINDLDNLLLTNHIQKNTDLCE